MANPTPQALEVLTYLKQHQTITQMEATHKLLCIRLAARIKELRDAGHIIETIREQSRQKKNTYYAKYLYKGHRTQ